MDRPALEKPILLLIDGSDSKIFANAKSIKLFSYSRATPNGGQCTTLLAAAFGRTGPFDRSTKVRIRNMTWFDTGGFPLVFKFLPFRWVDRYDNSRRSDEMRLLMMAEYHHEGKEVTCKLMRTQLVPRGTKPGDWRAEDLAVRPR